MKSARLRNSIRDGKVVMQNIFTTEEMLELADALDDRDRLQWVFDVCNDPGNDCIAVGHKLQSVIAGGRVNGVIYEDERTAMDEARKSDVITAYYEDKSGSHGQPPPNPR